MLMSSRRSTRRTSMTVPTRPSSITSWWNWEPLILTNTKWLTMSWEHGDKSAWFRKQRLVIVLCELTTKTTKRSSYCCLAWWGNGLDLHLKTLWESVSSHFSCSISISSHIIGSIYRPCRRWKAGFERQSVVAQSARKVDDARQSQLGVPMTRLTCFLYHQKSHHKSRFCEVVFCVLRRKEVVHPCKTWGKWCVHLLMKLE